MDPLILEKIDAVLDRIKDPESGLSISRLGLVERVRYNEEKGEMYIFTDFLSHLPHCPSCAGVAMVVVSAIKRRLREEFQKEFPDLTIELV